MPNTVKRINKPAYTLRPDELHRFDQRNTVFNCTGTEDLCTAPLAVNKVHDPVSRALSKGVRAVDQILSNRFLGLKTESSSENPEHRRKPAEYSTIIKRAALALGAGNAGICRINPLWVYSHTSQNTPVSIPQGMEWALVLTVPMNPAAIQQSPAPAASAETSMGYMRMSVIISALKGFIQELGFRAIACSNDTALSIPLAVDAGLGEMGRHGLLVTPVHGPFIRLCKVFTDMPLEADKPIDMELLDYCAKCGRCAKACPVSAIEDSPEPDFKTNNPYSSPGILRWNVNAAKCHAFWKVNGNSCSSCMAACRFTAAEE